MVSNLIKFISYKNLGENSNTSTVFFDPDTCKSNCQNGECNSGDLHIDYFDFKFWRCSNLDSQLNTVIYLKLIYFF